MSAAAPEVPTQGPDEGSVVERYGMLQRAEGIAAPILTVLLAFLISGFVILLTTGSIADTL